MTNQVDLAARFLSLHGGPTPLLMPNAWDAGSAKLLASLGFAALATTSSGFAATLGRLDGNVTRDEAMAHAAALVTATHVPISADLENGFGHAPTLVATTIDFARATGLAGGSIEDFTGDRDDPIYRLELAAERVAAAADAAHKGPVHFVLTARAEGYLHGRADLGEVIARLQAYQEAGADVLFAPGVIEPGDLRTLLASVDRPVNVLVRPGCPTVTELGALGVRRVSVGGTFAFTALSGAADAAIELRDRGTYGYWDAAMAGSKAARDAFTPKP